MKFCKGDLSFKKLCPHRMTCKLYDNWIMKKIYNKEEGKEVKWEGKNNKCKNYEMF